MYIMQKSAALKIFWFFVWVISITSTFGIAFSIVAYGAPHSILLGIWMASVLALAYHRYKIWQRGYLERLRRKKGSLWIKKSSQACISSKGSGGVICADPNGYQYLVTAGGKRLLKK